MFGGNDDACCAGLFGNTAPLTAIQFSRVENVLGLIAMSPFFIGKSIRAEMGEEIELRVMPLELLGCRNRGCRLCEADAGEANANECGKNDLSHVN